MTSVLVVDDEGLVRNSLLRALQRHGYEVATADGYERAMERMNEKPSDILLTDLRMGGKDGLALIEATQATWPETRPILMSAFASARESQRAVDLGAVCVLCKPFDNNDMLGAIRQAVDSAHGFHGTVHGLSLVDMLQMFHYAQRSLTIHVLGNPAGSLSLREGQLIDARVGNLVGEEALSVILTCPAGAMRTAALGTPEQTISREFQSLLLDQLRRMDERARNHSTRPKVAAGFDFTANAAGESAHPKDSWFDLRSLPAASAQSPGSLVVPVGAKEELDQACARVVGFISGALAFGVVDLETGSLLGSNCRSEFPQSGVAALSTATQDLFRGPAVVQINNAVRQLRGEKTEGARYVDEVQLSTPSSLHFAKTLAGGRVAVSLVTNRNTNLAMAWVQLRSTLPSLEAELRRLVSVG